MMFLERRDDLHWNVLQMFLMHVCSLVRMMRTVTQSLTQGTGEENQWKETHGEQHEHSH